MAQCPGSFRKQEEGERVNASNELVKKDTMDRLVTKKHGRNCVNMVHWKNGTHKANPKKGYGFDDGDESWLNNSSSYDSSSELDINKFIT